MHMLKIMNGSIQTHTNSSKVQWYVIFALEDFTDHSFSFLKEFFSGLGLKERNLCIVHAQILTVKVFVNVAKSEAPLLKPFHYVRHQNLFIH